MSSHALVDDSCHDSVVRKDTHDGELAPLRPHASVDIATSNTDTSAVVILLCTLNGARFLPEQLNCIASQLYPHWRVVASDDGSSDATRALLRAFADRPENQGRIDIRDGPRRGATANFLSLATDVEIDAKYFAYCDQDDVWYPEKLERALVVLRSIPADLPALYCSRTILVDSEGRRIGLSPLFTKAPSFQNAMVQSLAGGNTMVFNRAARALLIAAGPRDVAIYDWWTYMLVTGAGGVVHYDPLPSIAYRQHGGNQVGSNHGLGAYFRRLVMVLTGGWIIWNDRNAAALAGNSFLLTDPNKEVLKLFSTMRCSSLGLRMQALYRAGFYRQTILGQVSLLLATLLKRF